VSEIASWPRSWIAIAQSEHGDPLADRDQHVELARRRAATRSRGEPDELVGRVAHRREHGDDAVSGLACRDEPSGDASQSFDVGDRVPPNFITTVPGSAALASGEGSKSVVSRR
jgi:hypothetical protein